MKPDYQQHDPRGWCGDPKRGAALGRPSLHEDGFAGRLYLRRVRLDVQNYDVNGTYFGTGLPLYWCANEDGTIDYIIRAPSRAHARSAVLGRYPKAKVRR